MHMQAGGPPPAYESLLHDREDSTNTNNFIQAPAQQADPAKKQGQPREFDIRVENPVKQGDGVSAYVSYKVITHNSHPRYCREVAEVTRRFSDFTTLHDKLCEKNKGVIMPCLPEKSAVQKFQMATDFIEQRRRALQVYVNKLAAHPVLRDSRELQVWTVSLCQHRWG